MFADSFEVCKSINANDKRRVVLQTLKEHLSHQSSQVGRVMCHSNANIDFFYPGCMRGISLELFGGYELSEKDRLWLHPAMHRTTTIFDTGCTTAEVLAQLPQIRKFLRDGWSVRDDPACGSGDQSAGVYVTRKTDDFAVMTEEFSLIIEHIPYFANMPKLEGKLSDWVNRYIEEVRNYDTLSKVTEMAKQLFPECTVLWSKNTNAFYQKDISYIYVNYAWRLQPSVDKWVYLKLHPSLGYFRYTFETSTPQTIICPSTIGYREEITAWSDMTEERQKHINDTLSWTNEELPFHRHIQRMPVSISAPLEVSLGNLGLTRGEKLYTKCSICGSSTAPFTPEEAVLLTRTQSIPFKAQDILPYIMRNFAKVRSTTGISMFNPDFVSADSKTFMIPPDALRALCDSQ